MLVSKRNGLSGGFMDSLIERAGFTTPTRTVGSTEPEPEPTRSWLGVTVGGSGGGSGATVQPSFLDRILGNFASAVKGAPIDTATAEPTVVGVPPQGSPTSQVSRGGSTTPSSPDMYSNKYASDIPAYEEGDPPEMSPGELPDLSLDEAAGAAADAERTAANGTSLSTEPEAPKSNLNKYLMYGGVAVAGYLVYRMMVKK